MQLPLCLQAQLPTSYFLKCLGKHLKYSSCLWPSQESTLDEAEEAMLGASSVCNVLSTRIQETSSWSDAHMLS